MAWQGWLSEDADAVLNACRALRYLRDGVFSSKRDAGEWALDRVADPDLVEAALRSRAARGTHLGRDRVSTLIDQVIRAAS
jgi:hypothetical protein